MSASLISYMIVIAIPLLIVLTWFALISWVLWLSGFRVPIMLRKSWQPQWWKNLKELSHPWYVVVSGVLLWGVPVVAAGTLFDYLASIYFGELFSISIARLVAKIIFFSFFGLVIGELHWERHQKDIRRDSALPYSV
jgi:hypothetical protein